MLEDLDRFACLAVGPGLGTDPQLRTEVAELVATSTPLVLDGDGLRALGDDPAAVLARRPAGAATPVLTPHEGEFRRLGGSLDPDDPAFDRIAAVRDLAARLGAVVLLKGPTTVVADPSGTVLLSDTGDQRLASAGTGDVLTGVVSAMLAGGVAPLEAAAPRGVGARSCRGPGTTHRPPRERPAETRLQRPRGPRIAAGAVIGDDGPSTEPPDPAPRSEPWLTKPETASSST